MTSVDGGCPGVKNVQAGVIGATSMQFPLLMASLGVEAVDEFIKTGKKPQPSPGLDFYNTGVALITDKPVAGVEVDHLQRGPDQVLGLSPEHSRPALISRVGDLRIAHSDHLCPFASA